MSANFMEKNVLKGLYVWKKLVFVEHFIKYFNSPDFKTDVCITFEPLTTEKMSDSEKKEAPPPPLLVIPIYVNVLHYCQHLIQRWWENWRDVLLIFSWKKIIIESDHQTQYNRTCIEIRLPGRNIWEATNTN